MTKLIFILDENTLAALEIPRPADELAAALRRGDALPEASAFNPEGRAGWRVLQLGGLVIVVLEPGTPPPAELPPALEPPLSARQRQVLDLLRQGLTTRQIALRLKISIRTVHFHVAALKVAFGAQTRAQAIWLARESEEE
jgi:DNA-binding CsgD family transcriptional regulator